jgi:hypothetical protein
MKLGLENKRSVAIMVALVLLAIYMLARTFSGSPAPASAKAKSDQAAKANSPSQRAVRGRGPIPIGEKVDSLNPTLRFDWLKNSEDREYAGVKRNIFGAEPEPQEKPKEVAKGPTCPGDPGCPPPPPVCPGPDPRCPPPPINLKFYGFASKPGEPKRVFLSSGDDVFVAAEGEVVNRRYRVVKILNTSVEIEDVLNNNKQTIPLSQG